jgi:hypothetical protein
MKSSNYVLHRYRIAAYHSLNNSNNRLFEGYFENIYLHFHILERKWRSIFFILILSIIFIFVYLKLQSFNSSIFSNKIIRGLFFIEKDSRGIFRFFIFKFIFVITLFIMSPLCYKMSLKFL